MAEKEVGLRETLKPFSIPVILAMKPASVNAFLWTASGIRGEVLPIVEPISGRAVGKPEAIHLAVTIVNSFFCQALIFRRTMKSKEPFPDSGARRGQRTQNHHPHPKAFWNLHR